MTAATSTRPADDAEDEQPTWLAAEEQSDQYLDVPEARTVANKALVDSRQVLKDTIEMRAMCCIYGDAGVGKSLCVNEVLRKIAPETTVRVVFRARPTARDIRHALHAGLHLPGRPPGQPTDFDRMLKEALSDRFRVLVCDEAQWMPYQCFEYWRHLWDDRHTQISVVFVGGASAYRVLKQELQLESRLYAAHHIKPMTRAEVMRVIPVFHPVWAGVDATLIEDVDDKAGHGNFRNWARITAHVVQGLPRHRSGTVDKTLIRWVYSRLGKG